MGIRLFKMSSACLPEPRERVVIEKPTGNPDPKRWSLTRKEQVGTYLLIEVNYPDCTNYEGNKILLFEGVTMRDLITQEFLDPHFFEDAKYHSPIARFEPTERGWGMGLRLARSLARSIVKAPS